jgi:hypothetical protein
LKRFLLAAVQPMRPCNDIMSTQDANSPPSRPNRRNSNRSRALKSAKLIYGGGFNTTIIDCLLIEMSDAGARVETAIMMQIPETLSLRLGDNTERQVRRRWALGNEIGLEFIPPAP